MAVRLSQGGVRKNPRRRPACVLVLGGGDSFPGGPLRFSLPDRRWISCSSRRMRARETARSRSPCRDVMPYSVARRRRLRPPFCFRSRKGSITGPRRLAPRESMRRKERKEGKNVREALFAFSFSRSSAPRLISPGYSPILFQTDFLFRGKAKEAGTSRDFFQFRFSLMLARHDYRLKDKIVLLFSLMLSLRS